MGKPAFLPELALRAAPMKVSVVGREIKMLRPICDTCQRGKAPMLWWKTCPHNPYVSAVPVEVTEPKYETEVVDGKETGRKKLVGQDKYIRWEERPNWVQISHNMRINSMALVGRKQRNNGFIFPHELRSPEYPDGIADPCEFRDCFIQTDLMDTRWGKFCRKTEAQLVGHDIRMSGGGGALEIGDTPQSLAKQARQLEDVPL